MPRVATEYSCPSCKAQGRRSQIVAEDSKIVCTANSSHVWVDVMEFKKLGPVMEFNGPAPMIAQQTARSTMQVTLPLAVHEKLKTRYAGRLDVTVAGFIEMIAEGEPIVVPQSDVKRMGKLLKQEPSSAAELFGLVFSATQDRDIAQLDAKIATDKLETYEQGKPGWVALDLSEVWEQAESRAQDSNEPVDFWAQKNLINGVKENWF